MFCRIRCYRGGMSDTNRDPEEAAHRARALLEQDIERRVHSVEQVVSAERAVDIAEQTARDAADAHARAWNDALNSGWTEKDLKAIGVRAPGTARARKGPRRTRTAEPAHLSPAPAQQLEPTHA